MRNVTLRLLLAATAVVPSAAGGQAIYGSAPYGAPWQAYPPAMNAGMVNPSLAPMLAPAQAGAAGNVPGAALPSAQATIPVAQQPAVPPSATTPAATTSIVPHPLNPSFSRYSPTLFGDAARPQIITRAARGAGIRAGYAEEGERISAALMSPEISTRLDARYPFYSLMIGTDLMPPVVVELKDVREARGGQAINLTVGAFEIVRPARLVLTAPTWRDYLILPDSTGENAASAQPQNDRERAAWDAAFRAGVAAGVFEARTSFSQALDRLDRDFRGMQRYQQLAAQGAVTLPRVSRTQQRVRISDGGERAVIGEQTIKLEVSPRFKATQPTAYR